MSSSSLPHLSMVVLLGMLAAPLAAFAQSPAQPSITVAPPAPSEAVADRYVAALAASWATTGLLAGSAGAVGTGFGAGLGCLAQAEIGCVAGAWVGGVLLASLGWIAGPGVGTALGARLDFLEGLAVWALGLASNGLVFGAGLLIGLAVDETGQTWGLGRVWGMITGTVLGALAQVFLTPLYAVVLFDDRPPSSHPAALTILPFVAPSEHGAVGGLQGSF